MTNWSLFINIVLLGGVFYAISRILKSRRRRFDYEPNQPGLDAMETLLEDDIISVRKVDAAKKSEPSADSPSQEPVASEADREDKKATTQSPSDQKHLMLILLAKEGAAFEGYDLLQALLTSGLRYGEGQLFHRHQMPNGQGPVLCSLAAASATGQFDMEQFGMYATKGLYLYMKISNNPVLDKERFGVLLSTGKQLQASLDCHLLDDKKRPLTEDLIKSFETQLTGMEAQLVECD